MYGAAAWYHASAERPLTATSLSPTATPAFETPASSAQSIRKKNGSLGFS
jgi:hypothetical protein